MFIRVRARVIIVRDERERPSREYILTESEKRESAEYEDWETNKPDGVVTFGILNTSGISVFCDVGIDVLHQQIGGEDSVDEISPDVAVVEVVLE